MKQYKVIAAFRSHGVLVEAGVFTPTSQPQAERLIAAGCLRELTEKELAKLQEEQPPEPAKPHQEGQPAADSHAPPSADATDEAQVEREGPAPASPRRRRK